MVEQKIKLRVRDIKDYPKPGIVFKDITPILAEPALVNEITRELTALYKGAKLDAVVGVEARGFIFGAILAHALSIPFVPVRKAGRLPYQTRSQEYALEY